MGLLDPPALPLAAASHRLRKWSNIGTRCVSIGQPVTYTTNASGESFNQMMALEAPFDAVRFFYQNTLASAVPIGPVKAAAIASPGNPHAVGASYVPVLFGGSATGSIPAGTALAPTFLVSDWATVPSIARTDGGEFPLLAAFTLIPSTTPQFVATGGHTGYGSGGRSLIYSGQGITARQRWWASYRQVGDYVTNPATWPNTFALSDYGPVAAVQFRARGGRIVTLAGLGDSLMQGAYNGQGVGESNDIVTPNFFSLPHVHNAALLTSTPAMPVTSVNFGISGQTTVQYQARLATLLSLVAPDILIYPPFSPNNNPVPTQASSVDLTGQTLAACAAASAVPILLTSIPSGFGVTDDAARKAVNAVTRAHRSVLVADHDAAISDGATPGRIAEPYKAYMNGAGNAADATHPNGFGHYTMGSLTAAQVRRLLLTA